MQIFTGSKKLQIRRLNSVFLILLASLMFSVLLITDELSFDVWAQVEYMNEAELDFSSIEMIAHIPRYIVVFPAYYISEFLEVELSFVYGWYLLGATVLTSILWEKSREMLLQNNYKSSLVLLLPFVLLFFVNGRFVFGLLGLSMLLCTSIAHANTELTLGKIIGMLLGLLLCTVSSGVFIVGLLYWLFSFVDVNKRKPKIKSIYGWCVFLLVLIPSTILASVFLVKNFSFFIDEGYGLLGVLSHGLGMFINPAPLLDNCLIEGLDDRICQVASVFSVLGPFFSVIFVFFALIMTVRVIHKLNLPNQANRGLILSAFGGVFGITTLMSFIFVLPICVNRKLLQSEKTSTLNVHNSSESEELKSEGELCRSSEITAGQLNEKI